MVESKQLQILFLTGGFKFGFGLLRHFFLHSVGHRPSHVGNRPRYRRWATYSDACRVELYDNPGQKLNAIEQHEMIKSVQSIPTNFMGSSKLVPEKMTYFILFPCTTSLNNWSKWILEPVEHCGTSWGPTLPTNRWKATNRLGNDCEPLSIQNVKRSLVKLYNQK